MIRVGDHGGVQVLAKHFWTNIQASLVMLVHVHMPRCVFLKFLLAAQMSEEIKYRSHTTAPVHHV